MTIKYDFLLHGEHKTTAKGPWGKTTDKALAHFPMLSDQPPAALIQFYILLRKCCALANQQLGTLSNKKAHLIVKVCDDLLTSPKPEYFPLPIWISGSGTQSNQNILEVISSLATKLGGDPENLFIHPNDDVNASQSTNDTYPTAIQIAAAYMIIYDLMPQIIHMRDQCSKLEEKYAHVIKIGRTHLQDAVPMTVGQQFGCYKDLINDSVKHIHQSLDSLFDLPIGGTAVGTGISAPIGFDQLVCDLISEETKLPFNPSNNKFTGISMHLPMNIAASALSSFATIYHKIANDLRLLASGPRCGIGELILPANEPGSSIMPGKVNPTQCEQATMVAYQVMTNQQLIQMCCSASQLELNPYKPLIGARLLESITLLSESIQKFNKYCLDGIEVNNKTISRHLKESLMLITGLKDVIGYDKCTQIAQEAYDSGRNLRDVALDLGYCDAETFDMHTNPAQMIGEQHHDDD